MNRNQFKRIINLLVPSIKMEDIKFGKTYYRAYLYVVPFKVQEEDYFLRMYMVDGYAEVNKGIVTEPNEFINSGDINNKELQKIFDE